VGRAGGSTRWRRTEAMFPDPRPCFHSDQTVSRRVACLSRPASAHCRGFVVPRLPLTTKSPSGAVYSRIEPKSVIRRPAAASVTN
jgi:hypothetical protein